MDSTALLDVERGAKVSQGDRIGELTKRIHEYNERLTMLVDLIGSFNSRVLGARPEDNSLSKATPKADGKLDDLSEAVGLLGGFLRRLDSEIQRLREIG